MRPLPCAPGWHKLDAKRPADRAVMDAFLEAEFAAAQRQLKRQHNPSPFSCPDGVSSAEFSGYFLGCIIPGTAVDEVQAQGVVTYTCKGSASKLRLGLNAEGQYKC